MQSLVVVEVARLIEEVQVKIADKAQPISIKKRTTRMDPKSRQTRDRASSSHWASALIIPAIEAPNMPPPRRLPGGMVAFVSLFI